MHVEGKSCLRKRKYKIIFVQSAGAVEYTECFYAEG